MGLRWDFVWIISIALLVLTLGAQGLIDPQTAALAAVALVIFLALGRVFGGDIGHAVRWAFRYFLPIAAIAGFIIVYGRGAGEDTAAVLGGVATVVIVLFGLYIMVSGPFRNRI